MRLFLQRQHHPCPCCHGHFLRVEVLIRHLVYHHEDFVTGAILATDDYVAEHVNCRFCGKQFLRRHQKLLMLHIEQKHVDDLRRLLDIRGAILCCREIAPTTQKGIRFE